MQHSARAMQAAKGGTPPAMPTRLIFVTSSFFHYLGPSFAVILFALVPVLGVAWLRIATAALVYAAWRRPWRKISGSVAARELKSLAVLGGVFAAMNASFYLALAKIPLATVGAIEFLAPVGIAVAGVRSPRNFAALSAAAAGAYLLSEVQLAQQPLALAFAFANCALFGCYIVLGHRAAQKGAVTGIDRIGSSMLFALAFISPFGFTGASVSFFRPVLLAAGMGVGVCSSVIPYVLDQIAMARLPRATFALMLSILPAMATIIGVVVLRQVPTTVQVLGVSLIVIGVAVHRPARGGT